MPPTKHDIRISVLELFSSFRLLGSAQSKSACTLLNFTPLQRPTRILFVAFDETQLEREFLECHRDESGGRHILWTWPEADFLRQHQQTQTPSASNLRDPLRFHSKSHDTNLHQFRFSITHKSEVNFNKSSAHPASSTVNDSIKRIWFEWPLLMHNRGKLGLLNLINRKRSKID